MKNAGLKLSMVALSCSFALSANAASTLFTNVDIFNGTENKLYENHHVLVEDNLIKQISASPIEAGEAVVIDGEGKTLMPGLIEGHGHLLLNGGNLSDHENLSLIHISEPTRPSAASDVYKRQRRGCRD